MSIISRKTIGSLVGVVAVLAGCAVDAGDDASSSDQAQTAAIEREDDFVVLDRMGRPEMTNVTMGIGARDFEADGTAPESAGLRAALSEKVIAVSAHVKAYNRQNTFHPKPGERAHAERVLGAGIRALDKAGLGPIPDAVDWKPSELEILTEILSEDALVVDLSKPCDIDTPSFFDIEREELVRRGVTSADPARPVEHQTCGGRTLGDDIIDDVLTMFMKKSFDFASKDNPRRVSDWVDRPTLVDGNPTSRFPYLGEPHADYRK
jgi:hypothetical protein